MLKAGVLREAEVTAGILTVKEETENYTSKLPKTHQIGIIFIGTNELTYQKAIKSINSLHSN